MRCPRRLALLAATAAFLGAAALIAAWWVMLRMPGASWRGPLPPLAPGEETLALELRRDVSQLARSIGPRNLHAAPQALVDAADHVAAELARAGVPPRRHCADTAHPRVCNVEGEVGGGARRDEIVVIGAHYDSVDGPGADDNASGVAALLALARRARPLAHTVRYVAFPNEEAPYFASDAMGSLAYARRCHDRHERVVAMMSIESVGYYATGPRTQRYPAPVGLLYPSTGDFLAFVSDVGSRALLRRAVGAFRRAARFPSEAGALPRALPGIAWSDHSSFWRMGFPAFMVTDTAPYRNPHYHRASDRPETLDYSRMARVVAGLRAVIDELAGEGG